MSITSRELLRAGLKVCGKFPDIYWSVPDISGNELRVLHLIYDSCVLLESKNAKIRRTHDGCPILYTSKEKLAESCCMTEITFRTCIKSLKHKGLISDKLDGYSNCYGIAISSLYLNEYVNKKGYTIPPRDMDNFYPFLIKVLYTTSLLSTDILSTKSTKSTKSTNINIFSKEKVSTADLKHSVVRVPIINRVPIISEPVSKLDIYKDKLKSLKSKSCSELGVIIIARYYENKCRIASNTTGFKALPLEHPEEHKNWKHFNRVYDICTTNDIDYRVYLDAQFERVTHWNHGNKYPFANQLYSEAALKYYYSYEKETKQKMGATKDYKLRAKKMKTVRQEVIDDIIRDCDVMSSYLTRIKDKSSVTPGEDKAVYIYDQWRTMSIYYLVTIPWFKDILDEADDSDINVDYKDKYKAVTHNKKLMSLINSTVKQVEKYYHLPENIVLG